MTRKFFLSFTLVLMIAALFSGVALAAEGDPGQPDRPFPGLRRFGVRGEITAVNLAAGSFTFHTPRDEDLTFLTSERTKFRGPVGSLEDLEVGMPGAVLAIRQDQGDLLALQVIVHEELDRVRRYGGEVTGLDPTGDTITLATQKQGELAFTVDEKTLYRGALKGFGDLETGQIITILGATLEDGSLKALLIFAPERPRVRRFGGEVTAVELDQLTFNILTWRGENLTIVLDRETDFLSRGAEIDSLEDLEAGMKVIVGAELQPDGGLLGKRVLVHPPS